MKAKLIRENINFERRGKPLDKIGIGQKFYILSKMQEYANEFGWREVMVSINDHPEKAIGDTIAKWIDGNGGQILLFTSLPDMKTKFPYNMETSVGPIGVYWSQKDKSGENFNYDFELAGPWATRERWEELMGIKESINFERGKDPYDALNIGQKKNAYILRSVEREFSDKGPVKTHQDYLNAHEMTWGDTLGDDDIIDLLDNWEEEIDGSYNFWVNAHDADEEDDPEYIHAPEMEGDWITYHGNYWKIPHTDVGKRYLGESMDFERGADVLRATRIGATRNIPKYHEELANDIIEEFHGWGNGNTKLDELWLNLANDMEEYGYYTLEDYYEITDEDESRVNPIIENAIQTYKWALTEYAKQYVWRPEAVKEIVKTLFYYKANPADVSFDSVKKWIDKALKLNWNIQESVNFERGQEPKSALSVGHAHLYPDKELFKRIYNYWDNILEGGWPDKFQELTPIEWDAKEINFKVFFTDDSKYVFYLTRNDGVIAFYYRNVDTGGGGSFRQEKEFRIINWDHFIRILETNHVKFMPESQNFERGKEPHNALNIGKYRTVKKGDNILIYYKGEVKKATALDDEEVDMSTGRNFVDFQDEEGDICWAVRGITDTNVWFVPSANESVNFERGKDVKETIRVGTYSKLWAELKELNGPDGFQFSEDDYYAIDNDYDTHNSAILAKLYKLLKMGSIFKKMGEQSDSTEVILYQTPAGPIFSWDFDYGTAYGTPIEWWPKIKMALMEIPVSREIIMKQDGWDPNDPEEVKEFEEWLKPEIEELISESLDFERGRDPKDAMQIGDIQYRKKEKIKEELRRALKILVHDLNINKSSVHENFDGKGIDIEFKGKWLNKDCVYFLGYNMSGDIFNSYYAGYSLYGQQGSATNHYGSIGEAMSVIRKWVSE